MRQPDWESGDVQLYLGDCLDILKEMPDKSVDAVFTDPPYGTQGLAGGYGRRQLYDSGDGLARTIVGDDDLSLLSVAYPQFGRLIESGWSAVFYAPRRTPQFVEATSADDWFGEVIWNKLQMGLGYHIRYSHENIAIFQHGAPERPEAALGSVVTAHQLDKEHPHAKPVPVVVRLIEWMTKQGGLVLDPFMGSGTTGVACVQTGRRFIGIEIDPDYFKMAKQRIQEAQLQIRMPIL